MLSFFYLTFRVENNLYLALNIIITKPDIDLGGQIA
jgi:hypothetical protein